jgi:AcrR family transcriptional regulator
VGDRLLDDITKATAAAESPREQVEVGFVAYFRFVAEHPSAFRVLFGGGTRRDEEFARQATQVEEAIAEAVAALIDVPGLGPVERRLLAHGVVGLAEGISRVWMASPHREPPEQLAALVADLAWRGLRGVRA